MAPDRNEVWEEQVQPRASGFASLARSCARCYRNITSALLPAAPVTPFCLPHVSQTNMWSSRGPRPTARVVELGLDACRDSQEQWRVRGIKGTSLGLGDSWVWGHV